MIYSYDFQHSIRDVSPVIEVLKKDYPTFYSTVGTGAPVSNRTAEWIDKSLGVAYDDVLSVTGLNLTVADGSKYAAGMELGNTATADNYIVASVNGNVLTVTKAASGMNNPVSGKYEIGFGPVVEGSESGREVFWEGVAGLNYTQIVRSEAKLSRTALGTSTYDNSNAMNVQVQKALYDVYHEINRTLIRGTKKLGNTSAAGRCGGLYEFCSAQQIDANNAKISLELMNQAFEKLNDNAVSPNFIICNPVQIKRLTDIYKDQILITQDEFVRGVYVSKIRNPFNAQLVTIIADKMIPTGDFWLFDSTKVELCWFTNGGLQDYDSTPNGYDGLRRTVIAEFTCKFHNPSEAFVSIRNCKITA